MLNFEKLRKIKNLSVYYFLFFFAVFFQTFTTSYPPFMRLGMYFGYSSVLFIPEVLGFLERKSMMTIKLFLIVSLLLLFYFAGPGGGTENYYFFWATNPKPPFWVK